MNLGNFRSNKNLMNTVVLCYYTKMFLLIYLYIYVYIYLSMHVCILRIIFAKSNNADANVCPAKKVKKNEE